MENLTGMVVFARVVAAGSFTAAARELGLSKSTVSKQVAHLEDRLGVRLLNRTTRRLGLTEVGRAFYARCARIVAEAEEAELAVSRLDAEPRGTLRVNAPVSFGVRHLGPALAAFLAQYAKLKVDLTLADRFVDLVEEGYDAVVRIAALPDSALIARKVAVSRRFVCASPAYFDANGRPTQPRELAGHNCLGYLYLATQDAWPFRGPQGPLAVRVSGSLNTNNGEVLLAAALAGLGVAFLPTFICGGALADGRLEAVLTEFEAEPQGIHVVYPHARHLSAKVRAFVDFMAGRFGASPSWDTPSGA